MSPGRDSEGWQVTLLESFPPLEKWDDWVEYDASAWPRKVEKRYMLVPTTCFNCEAACGLVAYVDRETNTIRKLEGNPHHPGSRGRNCAKGPATLNQIEDPGRILYPMKRVGPRGSGQFARATWDEALDAFATKIRTAIVEDRRTEVMYHVGRPGHDGYMDRVLQSWGVDGHNSHTNVCSAAAPRLRAVDRRRPALARPREREVHAPALVAPRDGALLQPARAADHRGQDARREARRRRRAALEHGVDGGLVARALAGDGGVPAARDGAHGWPCPSTAGTSPATTAATTPFNSCR